MAKLEKKNLVIRKETLIDLVSVCGGGIYHKYENRIERGTELRFRDADKTLIINLGEAETALLANYFKKL